MFTSIYKNGFPPSPAHPDPHHFHDRTRQNYVSLVVTCKWLCISCV